jgi:predicted N-acetyltransferase YhbS
VIAIREERAGDEAFMARELRPGAGAGVAGIVHYRSEFEGL